MRTRQSASRRGSRCMMKRLREGGRRDISRLPQAGTDSKRRRGGQADPDRQDRSDVRLVSSDPLGDSLKEVLHRGQADAQPSLRHRGDLEGRPMLDSWPRASMMGCTVSTARATTLPSSTGSVRNSILPRNTRDRSRRSARSRTRWWTWLHYVPSALDGLRIDPRHLEDLQREPPGHPGGPLFITYWISCRWPCLDGLRRSLSLTGRQARRRTWPS